MRRVFQVSLVLFVIVLAILVASLFTFIWVSPDRSTRLGLSGGAFYGWVGSKGDYDSFPKRWYVQGWSGSYLKWRVKYEAEAKMFIVPRGTTGLSTPLAKQLTGTSFEIPMVYVLAIPFVGMLVGWPEFAEGRRRRKRRKKGQCEGCGYELEGVRDASCPECGLRR